MAELTLEQAVNEFRRKAFPAISKIHKDATIRVAKIANTPRQEGGRLPKLTGALQRSITAESAGTISTGVVGFETAIKTSPDGSDIQIAWDIDHGTVAEFGDPSKNRPPAAFIRTAALQFSDIVDELAIQEANRD